MTAQNERGEDNPGFELDTKQAYDPPSEVPPKKSTELTSENLSPEMKKKKYKILKNIVIISAAFMLNFTGFGAMANLQSSLNKTLGTTSLWVLYAGIVLSCAFVPSWLIKQLKTKWTLAICMLTYSSYIAAQFYPTYFTLIPTAFLLGMGAAPMWSAKCSYLTQTGEIYAKIVGEESSIILTRFFGIFFLFSQSSNIWGNIISSTVLSSGIENVTRTEEMLAECGSNFCPAASKPSNDSDPTAETEDVERQQKIITMSIIYLCISIASAAIVAIFVDPLSTITTNETISSTKSGKALVVATFSHMKKINQLLVIPITMWSGLEQAFLGADFTAAFVTCGLGVHMVGYILVCYGVFTSLCSIGFSPLVKRFGRVPIMTFGAVINLSMFILLNLWTPNQADVALLFFAASAWGVADAIWQAQINALYGVLFTGEPEAAFSNYRLWESLGFILAYVGSGYVCVDAKIYTLVAFLLVGMVGYYVVEFFERKGGFLRNGKKVETIGELLG